MKMDTEQRRMYIFLLALTVACTVGLQGWRTLLNNFAVEIAHVDGMGMGVVQSLREVPGFLALLIVYVLLVIKEHRLAALSILILGLGVAMTGFFPSVWGLAFTTVIMSFGFHFAQTCNQSMSLQYFDSNLTPVVLGRQRSAGAIGNLVIGGLVFVMAGKFSYPALFAGIGGLVMLAGAVFYCFKPNLEPAAVQRRGMVLKKATGCFTCSPFWPGQGDRSSPPLPFSCWSSASDTACVTSPCSLSLTISSTGMQALASGGRWPVSASAKCSAWSTRA